MQLYIVAVGTKMPHWVDTAFHEYSKRMPPECRLHLKEIKPIERSANKTAETVMALEYGKIKEAIPKHSLMIALDERGREFTSVQLAEQLTHWQQEGRDVTFIIGGADGLDPKLKKEAHLLIRLSSFTLPHGMVRVMLSEQLYRAWSITQNHPYHRI